MQPIASAPAIPVKSYETSPQELKTAAACTAVSVVGGGISGVLGAQASMTRFGFGPAAGTVAGIVGFAFSLAIWGAIYWFAFQGKRPAQIVGVVLAALGILGGIFGAMGIGTVSSLSRIIALVQTVANVGAVWFLTRPSVLAYVAPPVPASSLGAPPPFAP